MNLLPKWTCLGWSHFDWAGRPTIIIKIQWLGLTWRTVRAYFEDGSLNPLSYGWIAVAGRRYLSKKQEACIQEWLDGWYPEVEEE